MRQTSSARQNSFREQTIGKQPDIWLVIERLTHQQIKRSEGPSAVLGAYRSGAPANSFTVATFGSTAAFFAAAGCAAAAGACALSARPSLLVGLTDPWEAMVVAYVAAGAGRSRAWLISAAASALRPPPLSSRRSVAPSPNPRPHARSSAGHSDPLPTLALPAGVSLETIGKRGPDSSGTFSRKSSGVMIR